MTGRHAMTRDRSLTTPSRIIPSKSDLQGSRMDIDSIRQTLIAFVENAMGVAVSKMEHKRDSIGFSRMIWTAEVIDRAGKSKDYIVRHDDGNGPFSLITTKSITHEGRLIDALFKSGLAVPEIFAISDDGASLIMEKCGGIADFNEAGTAKPALTRSFAACLARLHATDSAVPTSATDGPAGLPGDLDEYLAPYRQHCRPNSIIDAGIDWLRANKPGAPSKRVLVHGDAGPGNFMFDGDRFIALIDWEMAHPGDPMEDLAAIYFRTYIRGGGGDILDWYRPYIAASGQSYDAGGIEYFRFAQFCKAAMLAELFRATASPVNEAIFAAPLKRVEASLRWAQGDTALLDEMGFPPIPVRL